MTENELKKYAESFKSINNTPKTIKTCCMHRVSTGVNTTARHAYGGVSWMDYYRAFTNPRKEIFRCASCERSISTNPDIVDMNDDLEDAEGAHILFYSNDVKYFDLKYYIVPLCHKCNNPSKSYINIAMDITAVEEVGARIETK